MALGGGIWTRQDKVLPGAYTMLKIQMPIFQVEALWHCRQLLILEKREKFLK